MAVKSYSPKKVVAIVGTFILKSWDEITVDYNEDRWSIDCDRHGNAYRVKNPSNIGTIEITVKQTSLSNTYNSLVYTAISDTLDVAGVIPVLIVDLWNAPLHVMPAASIMRVPKSTYAKSVTSRTWQFKGDLTVNSVAIRG